MADSHAPSLPRAVQPLDDLESMDAPALRQLAAVLHEALEARQQQLLRHADELSTSKHVVRQLAVRGGDCAVLVVLCAWSTCAAWSIVLHVWTFTDQQGHVDVNSSKKPTLCLVVNHSIKYNAYIHTYIQRLGILNIMHML